MILLHKPTEECGGAREPDREQGAGRGRVYDWLGWASAAYAHWLEQLDFLARLALAPDG